MAYSVVGDLLIGDVQVGTFLSPQSFVDEAADEMNARIGMLYELPLPTTLPTHLLILLKLINNRIASGRLIMAAAVGGEDRELHAYGESLVRDAYDDLKKILDGAIALDGAEKRDTGNYGHGPSVNGGDEVSWVSVFEEWAYPPVLVPHAPVGLL